MRYDLSDASQACDVRLYKRSEDIEDWWWRRLRRTCDMRVGRWRDIYGLIMGFGQICLLALNKIVLT